MFITAHSVYWAVSITAHSAYWTVSIVLRYAECIRILIVRMNVLWSLLNVACAITVNLRVQLLNVLSVTVRTFR